MHEKGQTFQDKHTCEKCPKTFQSSNDMKEHISLLHKSENDMYITNETFSCNNCDNKFTTRSDYTKHITVHDEHKSNLKLLCQNCNITNGTNSCLDCPKTFCVSCAKKINTDKVINKAVETGVIDKQMEPNKFICKDCFKKRCMNKREKVAATKFEATKY